MQAGRLYYAVADELNLAVKCRSLRAYTGYYLVSNFPVGLDSEPPQLFLHVVERENVLVPYKSGVDATNGTAIRRDRTSAGKPSTVCGAAGSLVGVVPFSTVPGLPQVEHRCYTGELLIQ